jgi:hypothetical protein
MIKAEKGFGQTQGLRITYNILLKADKYCNMIIRLDW